MVIFTESVELLAGVAELNSSQLPPELLEIAQLCGRLPLCLNIGACEEQLTLFSISDSKRSCLSGQAGKVIWSGVGGGRGRSVAVGYEE